MVVAETGVPPATKEIIDIDLDDYPELPPDHAQYERRRSERIKIAKDNAQNAERRACLTLTWTTLSSRCAPAASPRRSSLRTTYMRSAHCQASEYQGGISMGHGRGRSSWTSSRATTSELNTDKKFYDTALDWQKNNRLANGASAHDFQQRGPAPRYAVLYRFHFSAR